MSITYDEGWILSLDGKTHARQVYRDGESIGRVHRWQEDDEGLTLEWFIAERKNGPFYEPIAGEHAAFEEAMDRIVFYGVMQ